MRHFLTLAALGALATACVDRTPTATSPVVTTTDFVPSSQLTITLGYVCGATFSVTTTPVLPIHSRILFSTSEPGRAKFEVIDSASAYVDGTTQADTIASTSTGIYKVSHGFVTSLTSPIVPCSFSTATPPAGTVSLFYVCQEGWGVRNTNPVAYRFRWFYPFAGTRYEIDVPAATSAGPAYLFFGHQYPRLAGLWLEDGTGQTVIDRERPKDSQFSKTCLLPTSP